MWLIDPFTKKKSVSLTLLAITFAIVLVVGMLNTFDVVKHTSIFTEVFYSTAALYWGRKFNFAGKGFSSEKAEAIAERISEEKSK